MNTTNVVTSLVIGLTAKKTEEVEINQTACSKEHSDTTLSLSKPRTKMAVKALSPIRVRMHMPQRPYNNPVVVLSPTITRPIRRLLTKLSIRIGLSLDNM